MDAEARMRKPYLPLVVGITFSMTLIVGCAQVPIHSVALDDTVEFVEEWYICGPFDPEGSDELRNRWAGPDGSPQVSSKSLLKERYDTNEGRVGWQVRSIDTTQVASTDPKTKRIRALDARIIDFLAAFPEKSINRSAYAMAFIETPAAQRRTLLVGGDDWITIWLNGKEIHHMEMERPIVPDEDLVIADFKEGTNVLLVHVVNIRGYWGFMLRFVGTGGSSNVLLPSIEDILD